MSQSLFRVCFVRRLGRASCRVRLLLMNRKCSTRTRIKQDDLNYGAILGKTDIGIPVLRYLAGNRFIRYMNYQYVVRFVIGCSHVDTHQLLDLKMMHDGLNDQPIFQHYRRT